MVLSINYIGMVLRIARLGNASMSSHSDQVTNYQHNIDVNYNLPINKLLSRLYQRNTSIPQDVPVGSPACLVKQTEFNWGNTIRNSNTIQANGRVNMNTLYNRSTYLKDLTRKYETETTQ